MVSAQMLQTEFPFSLPRGYVDDAGNLHRQGIMRLATALDEVEPLADLRVQGNDAYMSILLLSRVVTRLGGITPVGPMVIEGLFSSDFSYLQDLYMRVNELGTTTVETECPSCSARFALDLAGTVEE